MLDQSFSASNFRIIFDISNRNGLFVEDKLKLTSVRIITAEIKKYGTLAKAKKKSGNFKLAQFFNEVKESFRDDRNKEIESVLAKISSNINQKNFKLELKIIRIPGGKDLYTIDNTPEYFFAIKQVQHNVSRLFDVKQSDRNSIVRQLITLLSNKFPKTIIRTDISNFYESIDHETILKSVNQDNLLSPKSRKVINQILRSYKLISGTTSGVPRGIGVSAYLAELFMRKIDRLLRSIPGVIYYARFVDDIVMVFIPNPNAPSRNVLDEVIQTIESNSTVLTNPSKTFQRNIPDTSICQFEFLGYEFTVENGVVKTKLTAKKLKKLEERLELAFSDYLNLAVIDQKTARDLLIYRIRFLTGNTRLVNNKSKILIGIYYSNSFLTELGQLRHLDNLLKRKSYSLITSGSLQSRLDKYTFIDGFNTQRFSPFSAKQLKNIMKIWK
ncbi:antiviral reverse transcriptase Drt3a [Mariniflexile ostreae]|uniref:Antiviral reverse transcriptase Drt3a n=1 Tax=Mariniflexile ostreae TaxID=1520892 RepID=A0ABV5FAT6_9FLAO